MTTLAELRQANIKEQKLSAQKNLPIEIPPAPPIILPKPVSSTNGHTQIAPAEPVQSAPEPGVSQSRDDVFLARIREAHKHKLTYPTGAKVSADMPHVLFHRVKRYCLDHGNITLRQALLDLLTVYLEEEGY